MQTYRGELQQNVDLKSLTSWRVGGKAQQLFKPKDLQDLQNFLSYSDPSLPITWLGLGSNVLIRDNGIGGIVVLTHQQIQNIALIEPSLIRVEAGLACAKTARFAMRQHLTGAEFLAGIPGTMGGALAMNAGAWGQQTWEIVEKVETIDRQGQCHIRYPQDFKIAYRQVDSALQEWFVAAYLRLQASQADIVKANIQTLLRERSAKQPTGKPCAGSVFRNPENDFAARLIEQCGLKGLQIGQASVSTKHANFIINLGAARSQDIENLIQHLQIEVEKRFQICLQREVHILGE